jgi:hypothetical protein
MFAARGNSENYIRIQPTGLHNANPQMDDATDVNIKALMELGNETAQNCPELDRIVDVLLSGTDPVEF